MTLTEFFFKLILIYFYYLLTVLELFRFDLRQLDDLK